MKVLVGCEYSGIVRDAFINAGHDAISCDILPTESVGPHIIGDIIKVLKENSFDLVILHPPCTYLCVSGNRWYSNSWDRCFAIWWTQRLWELAKEKCKHVCMENPVGVLATQSTIGEAAQYIQPWQFGHGETKKTGLWLYNLPELKPTNIVDGREQRIFKMSPGINRGKERSKFYTGIAAAMADQWGDIICQP